MTPPVQQHALDAKTAVRPLPEISGRIRLQLMPGDLVALFDVWALLAVLWVSRAMTGTLDPAVAFFGVVTFAFIGIRRGRQDRMAVGALEDAGTLFKRVWLAYAFASAVSILTGVGNLQVVLAVAAATAPLLIGGRSVSYGIERAIRRRGPKSKTLVVGAGLIARRIISILSSHDEYGMEVVGAVDDDPRFDAAELGTRLVGGLSDLPDLIERHGVENVIVAFSSGDQAGMVDVIRTAMSRKVSVWIVPRFFELGSSSQKDHLWGMPVARLQTPARHRPEWVLKRALDYVLSVAAVILLSPLLAVITLLILLESGRPILHRQQRVGLDGVAFDVLKFRSMRPAEETDLEQTEWREEMKAMMGQEAAAPRVRHDQRLTRIGRFLRKTSLDELPQLINVLKGEMSLVGPRPERPYFVKFFSEMYPNYSARHRLPAGLTGWAQIHGLRGDTSIEERAAFDNHYIENWSLAQDIKIMLRTVRSMPSKD